MCWSKTDYYAKKIQYFKLQKTSLFGFELRKISIQADIQQHLKKGSQQLIYELSKIQIREGM